MRYTFEECNIIYCISSTFKNKSAGKGWSFKIGNPGQVTQVWGGHFDRFSPAYYNSYGKEMHKFTKGINKNVFANGIKSSRYKMK